MTPMKLFSRGTTKAIEGFREVDRENGEVFFGDMSKSKKACLAIELK